jgi:hypothetical protein
VREADDDEVTSLIAPSSLARGFAPVSSALNSSLYTYPAIPRRREGGLTILTKHGRDAAAAKLASSAVSASAPAPLQHSGAGELVLDLAECSLDEQALPVTPVAGAHRLPGGGGANRRFSGTNPVFAHRRQVASSSHVAKGVREGSPSAEVWILLLLRLWSLQVWPCLMDSVLCKCCP